MAFFFLSDLKNGFLIYFFICLKRIPAISTSGIRALRLKNSLAARQPVGLKSTPPAARSVLRHSACQAAVLTRSRPAPCPPAAPTGHRAVRAAASGPTLDMLHVAETLRQLQGRFLTHQQYPSYQVVNHPGPEGALRCPQKRPAPQDRQP